MIKLYQFPRAFGLPNPSTFSMKLECALRMARLEHEISPCTDSGKGPKGKVPFIEAPFESRLREEAECHTNLVAFCGRMMQAYFPEFVEAGS